MIRDATVAILAAIGGVCLCVSAGATEPGRSAVLVMPVDFEVGQVTAGGVFEALSDESEVARIQLAAALGDWLSRRAEMEPTPYPVLGDAESGVVSEHVALFDVAVQQAFAMQRTRKGRPFDYSIGSGLAFLKARTGADKAILFSGASLKSTGGRTALKILELLMFGVMSPLSASMTYAGIIDLETGQIEWANHGAIGSADVTEFTGARDAVNELLETYPGGPLSVRPPG